MREGRDIAPVINELLSLPFILRIATRDFHPDGHISFASSHSPPNNVPFQSKVEIRNPRNDSERFSIPLWPVHCVQNTDGAEFIPELHASKFDKVVNKGRQKTLEMFSGFADVFGHQSSDATDVDLTQLLSADEITHVFAVGLAGDYCVKHTALDARKRGFEVLLVEEGIKSIDPGDAGWIQAKKDMENVGIQFVHLDGQELGRLRENM